MTNVATLPVVRSCNTCGVEKPLDAYRYANGGRSLAKKCVDCNKEQRKDYHKEWFKKNQSQHSARMKKWWKENPDPRGHGYKNRPDKVKNTYGITYEDVLNTFQDQLGCCANTACGQEISLEVKSGKDRAVIDHNHETGKFRALLCSQCNLELGKIEKDKKLVLGLFAYLRKHTTIQPKV